MLAASRAGYNLIFAVGFLNYSALNTVAPKFPKLQYVGIDEAVRALQRRSRRTRPDSMSAEQEAGYLVGYLAGLEIKKQGGKQIISAVGAIPVPAIVRGTSAATSRARRRRTRRSTCSPTTRTTTRSTTRPKCAATADQQITQGHAGHLPGGRRLRSRCAHRGGEGPASGASASTPTSCYLGSFMMTSALKTVDKAVSRPYEARVRGEPRDAAGLQLQPPEQRRRSRLRQPEDLEGVRREDEAIGAQIAAGKIKVKPDHQVLARYRF